MSEQVFTPSARPASSRPILPLMMVLFIGSGCCALIYEIIWYQLLQLVIGLTTISLGVLLGTFMGGMCLGSYLLPRLISTRRHPLRVYALLELGIGIIGIAVLRGLPYISQLYTLHGTSKGTAEIFLRAGVAAVCLLPPTILMGATLPAVARWVETTPQGVSWLGFFYGGNIAGAVFGCLLAGFYLLPEYNTAVATYVAATLNVTVAVFGLVLASQAPYQAPAPQSEDELAPRTPGAAAVYWTIALSGLTALGAEVVWTRLISLMLGATVYTFSIILAVFLVGLGLGSTAGSAIARSVARPRLALTWCQFLLTLAIAWTALMVAYSLPYWPINPTLSSSPWYTFQLDMACALWAILPGALLWGASFPLALAAVAARGQDPGRMVGGVYAANTVGAIVGSLVFSMLLVPQVGTQWAQRVMIFLAAFSALLLIATAPREAVAAGEEPRRPAPSGLTGALALTAVILVTGGLAWSVGQAPWGLIAFGRFSATYKDQLMPGVVEEKKLTLNSNANDIYCVYQGEGVDGSVAVTMASDGVRSFHAAGKVQASNDPHDMRLQRMLGHLSGLLQGDPKTVLVVACGAGVTAGTFVNYPNIKRIVICDINPLVPKYVTPQFKKENYDVVNNPKVEVVVDDGRHFIRTTKEKFDIITSDPIDPWVKGCAALNTVEYYEMCRAHLNPGGVVSLWLSFYECSNESIKSWIGTFFQVFPKGSLWSNDIDGSGYDAVLLGKAEPTQVDLDRLESQLNTTEYAPIKQSLEDVGFHNGTDLLATYVGQASALQGWLADAQINHDSDLRLQYLAGRGVNSVLGSQILNDITEHLTYPEEMFTGTEAAKALLKGKLKH